MKKQAIVCVVLLCIICFAGCAGNNPGEPAAADTPGPDTKMFEATEQDGGVLIRHDAEELVEVRVEDGKAELTFALEQWNKLYDIYNIYDAFETENASFLREGPYEVKSASGKGIKDVCVGMIEALNDRLIYGFDNLTLVLLLEDGTLEYCPVYPYPWQGLDDWVFQGWGKLPWLTEIVSLLYEPDGEGIGEMTIYAADKSGLCYDVRALCRLTAVFDCEWVYEIGPAYDDDIDCIRLTLWEDGQVFMTRGLLYNGDCWKFYEGKYMVSFTGGKPVLALELWDEWEDPDFSTPPELSGEYFFTSGYDNFTLYLADGDPLQYAEDNTPVMTYPFWADFSGNYEPQTWYEGDELVDYLLYNVPFAYELVHDQGMSALVTGETVDLSDMGAGVCRLVILGTDHPGHFVNEQFFAISDTGNIYVYSVVDDIWWYYAPYADEAVG